VLRTHAAEMEGAADNDDDVVLPLLSWGIHGPIMWRARLEHEVQ